MKVTVCEIVKRSLFNRVNGDFIIMSVKEEKEITLSKSSLFVKIRSGEIRVLSY